MIATFGGREVRWSRKRLGPPHRHIFGQKPLALVSEGLSVDGASASAQFGRMTNIWIR
jgi:hypothetical protein